MGGSKNLQKHKLLLKRNWFTKGRRAGGDQGCFQAYNFICVLIENTLNMKTHSNCT